MAHEVETQLSEDSTLPVEKGDVVLGSLKALVDGCPVIDFPDIELSCGISKSIVGLSESDIGCQVVVAFEGGDPHRPLVLGRVVDLNFAANANLGASRRLAARSPEVGEETLIVSEGKRLVLKCGESTITLTEAGKVIIEGEYVVTKARGVNRVKGASVQIN